MAENDGRRAMFMLGIDWETRTVVVKLPPVPEQGGYFALTPDEARDLAKQINAHALAAESMERPPEAS